MKGRFGVRPAGEDDRRDRAPGIPHLFEERERLHVVRPDVEEEDVGRVLGERDPRLAGRLRSPHREVGLSEPLAEVALDEERLVGIGVDDEDPRGPAFGAHSIDHSGRTTSSNQ